MRQINSSIMSESDNCTKNYVRTIIVSLIFGVVFLIVSETRQEKYVSPNKFVVQTHVRKDGGRLACLHELDKEIQSVNLEKPLDFEKHFMFAPDAVYCYSDVSDNLRELGIREGLRKRGRRLDWSFLHRGHRLGSTAMTTGKLKILYNDNTVITADLDRCRITGVYEPTPQGDVDPRMMKEFSKPVQRGNKVPAIKEPGDIAYGTNPHQGTSLFPWTAAIGSGGKWWCSGTIIARRYVLTARHCLRKYNGGELEIFAGGLTIGESSGAIVQSDKFWKHPKEDIALVRLHGGFHFGEHIDKISRLMGYFQPNWVVKAAGYGANEHDIHKMSKEFKYAVMNTKSDEWCHHHDPDFAPRKELCCAGGDGNTCAGDSGGPLTLHPKHKAALLGLNSWSKTRCDDMHSNIDVFVSVVDHVSWIVDTMGADSGWSSVIVYPDGCKQTKWAQHGSGGFVKTETVGVHCP